MHIPLTCITLRVRIWSYMTFCQDSMETVVNPHEIIPISFNMGKVLQQNYQNYTKTFLVQTRSQSKAKSTRPSDTCNGAKSIGKMRKEIKPIIIDDEPTIIDLDTEVGIETQT